MMLRDLRARVLQASGEVRRAGRAVPEVERITAIEAFRRAGESMDELLRTLPDDDWHVVVLRGLDTQGLIGHLTGVELDVQRALAGDRSVAQLNHISSTQPDADRQRSLPVAVTREQWRAAVDATLALAADADPDVDVSVHTVDASVGALLVVRAFELWTHENDIRRALSQPSSTPDAPTLALMTALAARAVPVGARRIGFDEPTRVRLVLTGIGGGTWDVSFGSDGLGAGESVRIIADALDFCRLAANRAVPADLDLHIIGDRDRASRVLDAVMALALD